MGGRIIEADSLTAANLCLLLKKRDLLTREDLELPWRPLYELYERCLFSPYEAQGLLHLPP